MAVKRLLGGFEEIKKRQARNNSVIRNMAKKDNNELANTNQAFLIYQDDNGIARVNHKKFLLVRQE